MRARVLAHPARVAERMAGCRRGPRRRNALEHRPRRRGAHARAGRYGARALHAGLWPGAHALLFSRTRAHIRTHTIRARHAHAAALGAVAVVARFSRLLCDCNRPLTAETLFRAVADGQPIVLNQVGPRAPPTWPGGGPGPPPPPLPAPVLPWTLAVALPADVAVDPRRGPLLPTLACANGASARACRP